MRPHFSSLLLSSPLFWHVADPPPSPLSADSYLRNWTQANPGRSIYAFGWDDDRRKAGQVILGFRTNEKSEIQYWPVLIAPEGYMLRGDVHGDVQSLVNGFKIAYQASMSGGARGLAANPALGGGGGGATGRYAGPGGSTPNLLYGPGGNRTPAYPGAAGAGGRTPAGVYGGGRTPNPYGGQQPPPPGVMAGMGGGRTPNPAYGGGRTPNPYGGYGQR